MPYRRIHHPVNSKVYQPVDRAFGDQVSWIQHMRTCAFVDLPQTARCPLYKTLADQPVFLVVHLFSGRRRVNDFHHALHQLAQERRWQVVILSLDTAVSLEYGNLLHTSVSWNKLEQIYLSQRVAVTLCGPLCETYSEARFSEAPVDCPSWPRPLRSAERLFGLEGLSMRELRQCDAGGLFFLQCMRALAIHITCGGLFIAEHPAKPLDASRPRLPDLVLHHVAQFRWGAESIKPMGLLTWGFPFFRCDLYKQTFSDAVRPSCAAIGKTEIFYTSRLKEYPDRFCFALAFAIERQSDRLWGGGCVQPESFSQADLDSWILAAARTSAEIRANAHWLPDFHLANPLANSLS